MSAELRQSLTAGAELRQPLTAGAELRLRPLAHLHPSVVAAWERLAGRSSQDCPFSEPALAQAAARLLELGQTAQLLSVEQHGELLLALPVRRIHRWGPLPLLALAGWDHDYAFLGAPLLAPGQELRAWRTVLRGLRRRHAGTLLLPRHPLDGPGHAALAQAAREQGTAAVVLDGYERAVVHRRPHEDYLDGRLSATSRKGLRRHRRRLEESLGPTEVVDRSGTRTGLDVFLQLERSGWKGRSGTAIAARPAHAEMLQTVLRDWQQRMHILVLEAGGVPVAAQLNLQSGASLFACKIAYDEQYARFSPGLQLELEALSAFHHDARLSLLDSCTEPGHAMSERLFPDRRALATLAVPLSTAGRAGLVGYRVLRGLTGLAGRVSLARRRTTTAAPSD